MGWVKTCLPYQLTCLHIVTAKNPQGNLGCKTGFDLRRKVNIAPSLIKLLTLSMSSASIWACQLLLVFLLFFLFFPTWVQTDSVTAQYIWSWMYIFFFQSWASTPSRDAFPEVPNPREKPRTPPHVMKGDQAKSLVPITVRITADVKPKPNVAEIQVSHNEQVVLPFNTYGKLCIGYNSTWNLCCAGAYIKYRNDFSCIISTSSRGSRGSQSFLSRFDIQERI